MAMPERTAALSSFQATIQHIGIIRDKTASLLVRQEEAEEQLVHRVGVEYRAGRISLEDLYSIYTSFRDVASSGFARRWNAAVPVVSANLQPNTYKSFMPNGDDGSWWGQGRPSYPDDPAPPLGTCVVYVLYSESWNPAYIGSTQDFRARIKEHSKTKAFVYWRAWQCVDRDDAYRRESEMLNEVMPHLNRRRERRGI